MHPVQIKLQQNKDILILWNDGSSSMVELKKLRQLCPCATCQMFRNKQGINYMPVFNENQLGVVKIDQVGSYALQIMWKDGHNTGIFEYPLLEKLGHLV